MPVLNGQVVGDAYPTSPAAKGAILANVWNAKGGWFSVVGATAYVELQYGKQGQDHWVEEILLGAGAFVVLPPNCIGIQFRNGVAGVNATVTAQIAQGDEPPLAISTIGQTNTVTVASLNFQHNDLAVATQPTVDFEDATFLQFSTTNDVPGTRVKVGLVNVTLADKAPATQQLFTGPVGSGSGSTAVGAAAGTNMGTTGLFSSASAAATTSALTTTVTADTTDYRFKIRADGQHTWASGTANADVTLARSAANQLDLGTTTQEGRLRLFGATPGSQGVQLLVTTDTNPRLGLSYGGSILFGSGSATQDIQLGRNSAGVLFVLYPPLGTPANLSGILVDWVWAGAINSTSTSNQAFQASISTDTNPRYQVDCDGHLHWGPGGVAAFDTDLYRNAAASLNSNAFFSAAGIQANSAGIWSQRTLTAQVGFAAFLVGDAFDRWEALADGTLRWGTGAAAVDSVLGRTGVALLTAFQTNLGTGGVKNSLTTTGAVMTYDANGGWFQAVGATAAQPGLALSVNGDTNFRFEIFDDGTQKWGPGSGAADTTLARSSVGNLTLTGGLFVSGSIASAMGGDGASPAANAPGAAAGAFLNAGGVVQVSRAGASTAVFTVTQPGDATNFRFLIDNGGRLLWGAPPATQDVILGRVVNSPTGTGSFLELTAGAALGYGTGTGGTVTTTNALPSTGTINKGTGKITSGVNVASLSNQDYTITNSVVGADDVIIVNLISVGATTTACHVTVTFVTSGSFSFNFENALGVAHTPVFTFAVIKGAVA